VFEGKGKSPPAQRQLALDEAHLFFVPESSPPERTRNATEKWLLEHLGVEAPHLYMRDENDRRADDVVKRANYSPASVATASIRYW